LFLCECFFKWDIFPFLFIYFKYMNELSFLNQVARFNKAKSENNQRFLNIDSGEDSKYNRTKKETHMLCVHHLFTYPCPISFFFFRSPPITQHILTTPTPLSSSFH
jgi:hypothetical protein